MKDIKEDRNKSKISHARREEELILLKCPYYPKPSIDLMRIPIRIPMTFFTEIEKNNPKIHMKPQKTLNGQSSL